VRKISERMAARVHHAPVLAASPGVSPAPAGDD
jgi:hypothetical protein